MLTCLALLVVIMLVAYTIKTILSYLKKKEHGISILFLVVAVFLLMVMAVPLSMYSWPFDIEVDFEKIAQLQEPGKIHVDGDEAWFCIYDIKYFGELSEASYWGFPIINTVDEIPVLDLDKYTYMISFEREVTKLTYNVWDNKGPAIVDFGISTKWGKAELSDDISEGTVYIYRMPKIAVDNIKGTKYY